MNKLALKQKNHVEVVDGKVMFVYDEITRSRGWLTLEEAQQLTIDYMNALKDVVLRDENNSRTFGSGKDS